MAANATAASGIEPKPAPEAQEVELGVSMNLPFAQTYAGGNDFVKGEIELSRWYGSDAEPDARQLAFMRKTDGQARALYRLITLPIRSALKTSTFIPADGGDKEAQFIEQMLTLPPSAGGMTTDFGRFIAQSLLAAFDGFAAFEQVYWVPKVGPLKGKWTLKKLARRPAETITFLVDETGGFSGLRQRATFAGKTVDIRIPAKDAFYFASQEEERQFYGVSMFESAYYHYDKKVRLYYIAHLAAQRAAVDTRVGTIGQGASVNEINTFKAALKDLGTAQSITLPNDKWKIEALKGGGSFDFLGFINHHNSQMSKSVLAGFFDSNQGGGSSDTSLVNFGEQSDTLFMLMLSTIMNDLAVAINTYIIPKFIDWNFGSGKYPTFRWGTFTDEQRSAIADIFSKLAAAGQNLTISKEFMREVEKKEADEIGLEIDWNEVEKREQEEADMAKAQFNAQTAATIGGIPGAAGTPPGAAPAPGAPPPAGASTAGPDLTLPPDQWNLTALEEVGDVDLLLIAAQELMDSSV